MTSLKKKKCDGCKKEVRKLTVYKGRFLCYNCFLKNTTVIGRWIGYHKFDEPVTEQIATCLTMHQKEIIRNRAGALNTTMSDYIRNLIVNDLKEK